MSRTGPYWLFRTYGRPTVVSSSDQWHGPDFWRDLTTDLLFHRYHPRSGDVVVDIGAGMGEELPFVSEAVGTSGRIVAVEPHPATYDGLLRCIAVNGLSNCEPVRAAISDRTGVTMISDSMDLHANTTLTPHRNGHLEVDAFSLDDLCERRSVDRIDLLKMNIEGAERIAILGMRDTLERTRHVVISCHDFLADERGDESLRTKQLVVSRLGAAGFRVETRHDDRPFVADYVYGTRGRRP